MSDWDERREEDASWDWGDIGQKALIGAGCAGVVIGWMIFARPGDEVASSRGFNVNSAGGPSSAAPGRPFASRPKTGLDMVSSQIGAGPAGVTSSLYREGGSAPTALEGGGTAASNNTSTAGQASAAAAAGQTMAAAPSPAAPAPASEEDEKKALAAAGIPTDAKGLNRLGAQPGLLSALAAKMLDHPRVLTAIFNNKMVVNAFMNREISKKNCESGGALKSYLSDPNSGGMSKVLPVLQQALNRPATAAALAGTEMAKRVMDCPSVGQLSGDSTAVMSIAMTNPKALGVISDPRLASALASNPQASGLLAGVTSKIGGGN